MENDIKELIEKIHREGVEAAQSAARRVEEEAALKAQGILHKAEARSGEILDEARKKIGSMQKSSEETLKQAGRDLLLSLKGEVLSRLERLMSEDISDALTPAELSEILSEVIKKTCAKEGEGAIVYLDDRHKKELEGHFMKRLKDELMKGIELRAQEDVHAGLMISFDAGKSRFDLSDKALAQHMGSYLKPKLAQIFKDAK